jgi:hypothetical protein
MRNYERPTLVHAGSFRDKTGCVDEMKPGPWWEWIGPNYTCFV